MPVPHPWEDADQEQRIIGRRLVFCPYLIKCYDEDRRIRICPGCHVFAAVCCVHSPNFCHHWPLIFVDGSCLNNGQKDPLVKVTAGVGVAVGSEPSMHQSIPITDEIDPGQKRSSQRAELLAAIVGVEMAYPQHGRSEEEKQSLIIATDSEYVVKGMTEWFPEWKVSKIKLRILNFILLWLIYVYCISFLLCRYLIHVPR